MDTKQTPLSESDWETLFKFLDNDQQIYVIKGSAGTGKSTAIREIVEKIANVFVCAFTNKAAMVLQRKGIPAVTIHNAFYISKPTGKTKTVQIPVLDPSTHRPSRAADGTFVMIEKEEPIFDYVFDVTAPFRKTFSRDKLVDDRYTAICIIDESSMIPSVIWDKLSTFPDKIIIVGDDKQLEPVETELDNMIKNKQDVTKIEPFRALFSKITADTTLSTVYRTDEQSILDLANSISKNNGIVPYPLNNQAVVCRKLTNCDDPLHDKVFVGTVEQTDGIDSVVISWTNAGCAYLNSRIRKSRFGEQYQNEPQQRNILPRVGDVLYVDKKYTKLVETSNETFERTIITKGDTLIIEKLDDNDISLKDGICMATVRSSTGEVFEDLFIRLDFCGYKKSYKLNCVATLSCVYGYAITCHKSQGSEYDYVTVIDDLVGAVDRAKWYYTAVTRSRHQVTILKIPQFYKIISGEDSI